MKRRQVRFWARVVAANAAASILAMYAFGGATLRTPITRVLQFAGQSFVFSLSCSWLCIVVLPLVAPAIFRRLRAPLAWIIVSVVLVILAAGGSLIGMIFFWILGLLPASAILSEWVRNPLKISVICTLLFGIFFTVVERIRTREADARRVAAEAQLASLESRVQPHFLFNTLNSIASLIPDDPKAAERMTGQLATLLRSSLDQQGTPLVSIEDELQIVRNYLEIEHMRFGDRLRYDIAIDPSVAGARVPRLAVQTLVENSVKYAVSPRREGASIAIRATANDDRVDIEVADDGPGFDAAQIPPGHGLALVRERLAMTMGGDAALTIASRPGNTVVKIRVGRLLMDTPPEPGPKGPGLHDRRARDCERS